MDTNTKTNQAQGQQAAILAAFKELTLQDDIPNILEDLEQMFLAAMQTDLLDSTDYRANMVGTYCTIKRFLKSAGEA